MTKDEMRHVAKEAVEYFTQQEAFLSHREREWFAFFLQWLDDDVTPLVPRKAVPGPTPSDKKWG